MRVPFYPNVKYIQGYAGKYAGKIVPHPYSTNPFRQRRGTIDPVNTRSVRRAAPSAKFASAKIIAALAKKSGAMDPNLAASWDEIMGKKIAQLCRPVRLQPQGRAKALIVAAPHGAAAVQLHYHLGDICQKVNAYLGGQGITRVIIQQQARAKKGGNVGGARYATSSIAGRTQEQRAGLKKLPASRPGDLNSALARVKAVLDAEGTNGA